MARPKEHNFSLTTLRHLSDRVNGICSNPSCQISTKCAVVDINNLIDVASIGVGAHIYGAADGTGSKRYNPEQTPLQRRSIENGIWLCQNCSRLIDADVNRYPAELLLDWKLSAEENARKVWGKSPKNFVNHDVEILEFLRTVFDRPAFQVHFAVEGNYGDLRSAFNDTLAAINTGALVNRSGSTLRLSYGKSMIQNNRLKTSITHIAEEVQFLIVEFDKELGNKNVIISDGFYCFSRREFIDEMNYRRLNIINRLNISLDNYGLSPLETDFLFRL